MSLPGVFPARCFVCDNLLSKTDYEIHQLQGCNPTEHAGSTRKFVGQIGNILCPGCSETFILHRSMVEHYNKAHNPAPFVKVCLEDDEALQELFDELKGDCGVGLACNITTPMKRNYRCAYKKKVNGKNAYITCTAFVSVKTIDKTSCLDVTYCTYHSHPIERSFVTIPLTAKRMILENVTMQPSILAKKINKLGEEVPPEKRNFNHLALLRMDGDRVSNYISNRKFLADKRQRQIHVTSDDIPPNTIPEVKTRRQMSQISNIDQEHSESLALTESVPIIQTITNWRSTNSERLPEDNTDFRKVEFWRYLQEDFNRMRDAPPHLRDAVEKNLDTVNNEMFKCATMVEDALHSFRNMRASPSFLEETNSEDLEELFITEKFDME